MGWAKRIHGIEIKSPGIPSFKYQKATTHAKDDCKLQQTMNNLSLIEAGRQELIQKKLLLRSHQNYKDRSSTSKIWLKQS